MPVQPAHTAGHSLQSLRIHVRDHRKRDLPAAERSLEAHYGAFVLSQQRAPSANDARRRALQQSYGPAPRDAIIEGHEARIYERGPETPPDDIDGRSPAIVVWVDGDMVCLIASGVLPVAELSATAASMYR